MMPTVTAYVFGQWHFLIYIFYFTIIIYLFLNFSHVKKNMYQEYSCICLGIMAIFQMQNSNWTK